MVHPRFAPPPEGLTYRIALGVLLIAALAQFGAWAWIALPRPTGAVAFTTPGPGGTVAPSKSPVPPIADLAIAIPEDVPPSLEQNATDDPQLTPQQFVLRTALEYVQQARTARKRGDMDLALNKLREAMALVPDSAEVLAELATTYETMGFFDKASAHWAVVEKLGPERAGMYYNIAQEKLAQGVGDPAQGAVDPAMESSLAATRAKALIVVEDVTSDKKTQEGSATDVSLQIALKARSTEGLEIRDVKIQVYFYDTVDDQHVVLTNAEVSSEWQTPPPDWADGELETLSVHYHQEGLNLSSEIGQERRKYLGYIVRLYYKSELQDSVAEPARLLELFPPPQSLSL